MATETLLSPEKLREDFLTFFGLPDTAARDYAVFNSASIDAIIRATIAVDPQLEWLSQPPASLEVRTVVEIVQARRIAAASEGRLLRDRDVYLQYRAEVEVPQPDPDSEELFVVLAALMGGKISGKLPF